MSRKPGPAKGCPAVKGSGRKKIEIDWKKVDYYLSAGCLGTEIAGLLDCSPDTLYDRCQEELGVRFSDYQRHKKSRGDGSLRIKQYAEAIEGDRALLIWLGKQRLAQRENPERTEEFSGSLVEILEALGKVNTEKDFNKDKKID